MHPYLSYNQNYNQIELSCLEMQNNNQRFRVYPFKGFFSFSEIGPKSQRTIQMAERLKQMKDTMSRTTPKVFSILFMLSTIPTFYFMNQMLNSEYNDPSFSKNSNQIYKYFYITNITMTTCALGLAQMNFLYPSTENAIMRVPGKYRALPMILSLIGLMIPESDSKHLMWPALVTQFSTFVGEGMLSNFGYIPFWYYSYRYYIGLFSCLVFVMNYFAMKRFANRRQTHPQQFIKIVGEIDDEQGLN